MPRSILPAAVWGVRKRQVAVIVVVAPEPTRPTRPTLATQRMFVGRPPCTRTDADRVVPARGREGCTVTALASAAFDGVVGVVGAAATSNWNVAVLFAGFGSGSLGLTVAVTTNVPVWSATTSQIHKASTAPASLRRSGPVQETGALLLLQPSAASGALFPQWSPLGSVKVSVTSWRCVAVSLTQKPRPNERPLVVVSGTTCPFRTSKIPSETSSSVARSLAGCAAGTARSASAAAEMATQRRRIAQRTVSVRDDQVKTARAGAGPGQASRRKRSGREEEGRSSGRVLLDVPESGFLCIAQLM